MKKRAPNDQPVSPDLPQAMQAAAAQYMRGDWSQAERLCRQVLKAQADHFDALHLLGILTAQTRRTPEAAALLARAVAANPHDAAAHSNRGNALQALRRLDEALASYDRALKLKPDFAQAHCNRGSALQELNRLDEALDSYAAALKHQPDYAEAYYNRGVALQALDRPAEALESYDRALQLSPEYAEAHSNRGVALQELDRPAEALLSYERALALKPGYAQAHSSRGVALLALDRPAEALDSYERALKLDPGFAEAHSNRGVALHALNRFDEALASYGRALKLNPAFAQAHRNRGVVLHDLWRLDEALAGFERALKLKPDDAQAHSGRGITLQELNRLEDAQASYERALALKPDFAEAHFNLSTCLLMMGDFARGWSEYEWRWRYKRLQKTLGMRRDFTQPLWLGAEPLQGKTILLHCEQGYGDTIQFCRYASLLSGLGARVILEAPRLLLALLENLAGVAQLVEAGAELPAFDFHCPLLSLPLALGIEPEGTEPESIPLANAYIASDPGRVAQWQAKLGAPTRTRVGLSWSGSTNNRGDAKRSISLADLIKHLPPQFEYFSLQKDLRGEDKETLAAHANFSHYGADFADTAALCELMDVVVSVDTSIAHLAGAMGRPVWILLPLIPDWRWQLKGEVSGWYASARLFRQDKRGDWAGVFEKVRTGLLAHSYAHA